MRMRVAVVLRAARTCMQSTPSLRSLLLDKSI